MFGSSVNRQRKESKVLMKNNALIDNSENREHQFRQCSWFWTEIGPFSHVCTTEMHNVSLGRRTG